MRSLWKQAAATFAAAFATVLFGLLVSGSSAAELSTVRQTCTTANCGATVLYGRLNKSDRCCGFDNLTLPWVVQVYAAAGECLRLHVTQKVGNVELVAIAPGSHRAWRNGAASPLLKIRTAQGEAGWFLVQVNDAAGDPRDANFTLRYARYAATNPNCNAPSARLPSP
jgi:hypothetical protein